LPAVQLAATHSLCSTARFLTGLSSHRPRSAQRVPGTTEIAKKGTLRVDLQALTVGVALLAMHRWLVRPPACPASLQMQEYMLEPVNGADPTVQPAPQADQRRRPHHEPDWRKQSTIGLRNPSLKTPSVKLLLDSLSAQTTGVVVCRLQSGMRSAVASGPGGAPTLDGNRKLAVINGMGDHSRAQGNSSAVKEAIGACRL
jgi:hypothetical protein